jgi:hypothetical protein
MTATIRPTRETKYGVTPRFFRAKFQRAVRTKLTRGSH